MQQDQQIVPVPAATPVQLLETRSKRSPLERSMLLAALMRGRTGGRKPLDGLPLALFGKTTRLVGSVTPPPPNGTKPAVSLWLESFAKPGVSIFTVGSDKKKKAVARFKTGGVVSATGLQSGNLARGPCVLKSLSGKETDKERKAVWAPVGWGTRADGWVVNEKRAFWKRARAAPFTHPTTGAAMVDEPHEKCIDLKWTCKMRLGPHPITGEQRTVGELVDERRTRDSPFRGWRALDESIPLALALALSPPAGATDADRARYAEMAAAVGVTEQLDDEVMRTHDARARVMQLRALNQSVPPELLEAARTTPSETSDINRATKKVIESMGSSLYLGKNIKKEMCGACIDATKFMGFVNDTSKWTKVPPIPEVLEVLAKTPVNESDTSDRQVDALSALEALEPADATTTTGRTITLADGVCYAVRLSDKQLATLYENREHLSCGALGRQVALRCVDVPGFVLQPPPVYGPVDESGDEYTLLSLEELQKLDGNYSAVLVFDLDAFVSSYGKISPEPHIVAVYLTSKIPYAGGNYALDVDEETESDAYGYAPLPEDAMDMTEDIIDMFGERMLEAADQLQLEGPPPPDQPQLEGPPDQPQPESPKRPADASFADEPAPKRRRRGHAEVD